VNLLLTLFSGIAWTIVYIEAIRVGLRDRSYAIPIAALALNIAWESIYAVHDLASDISVQGFVNVTWAVADLGIVYTYVRFGRRELPEFVSPALFALWIVLIFATAYVIQGLFIAEFGWAAAVKYSAYLQNLLMSGLFIAMFVARRGARGQSLVIAVGKWLGTVAPTIIFWEELFIRGLGILCAIFDIAYIGLLLWERQRAGHALSLTR
jgi:hypothetical protein